MIFIFEKKSIMKNTLLLITIFLLTVNVSGAQNKSNAPDLSKMKQYYFVMLSRGPDRTQDSVTAVRLQEGHMANIMRMAEEKKLVIAGPFADNGDWRGIFIMDVASIDEAKKELEQDPAIKAGRLKYEIHPWWTEKGTRIFE